MKRIQKILLLAAAAALLSGCGTVGAQDAPAGEATPVRSAAPAAEPTATADAGTDSSSPDLEALYRTIQEELVLPDMASVPENRREAILGISEEDCVQAVTVICGDSVRADEIWMIEAVDEEAAERIGELAQNRLDQREDETENYLPDQAEVVRQAVLVREGNYQALFISPDAEAMEDLFLSAIGD